MANSTPVDHRDVGHYDTKRIGIVGWESCGS
jgi:hypothetical protein